MRVALDTNILAYAEGINGDDRQQRAQAALAALASDELVVPAQALAELFTVLTRKARWNPTVARAAVLTWRDACLVADTTSSVLLQAMDLSINHKLSLWDAVMISAAADASCRVLLSEDMQHGFICRGVQVRNPFS